MASGGLGKDARERSSVPLTLGPGEVSASQRHAGPAGVSGPMWAVQLTRLLSQLPLGGTLSLQVGGCGGRSRERRKRAPQLGKEALWRALQAPPSQALSRFLQQEAASEVFTRAEVTVPTAFEALATPPPLSRRLSSNRTILGRISELYMVWPGSLPLLISGDGGGEEVIAVFHFWCKCRVCARACDGDA